MQLIGNAPILPPIGFGLFIEPILSLNKGLIHAGSLKGHRAFTNLLHLPVEG